MGVLTEDEMKDMLVKLVNAQSYQTEIDEQWVNWWKLYGGLPDQAQTIPLMKIKLLEFLQGKYRTRYNATQGTEKREAFQLFQAVSQMLNDARAEAGEAGVGGYGYMGSQIMSSIASPDACDVLSVVPESRKRPRTRDGFYCNRRRR